jgi:hypothetical protein
MPHIPFGEAYLEAKYAAKFSVAPTRALYSIRQLSNIANCYARQIIIFQ